VTFANECRVTLEKAWPPSAPDLYLCDFFVWGLFEGQDVSETSVHNLLSEHCHSVRN
jgi:hypothetical protein